MLFNEFYPDYYTSTILEWKHLLKPDKYKVAELYIYFTSGGISVPF